VEFVPLALDSLYDALAAEKVDLLISSLPFIYERQREVRYSQPYYDAGQVIVVRQRDNRVRGPANLARKRVGVELGSTADTEARWLMRTGNVEMELEAFDSPQEALDALVRRGLDAVITDNTSAHDYLAANRGAVSIVAPALTSEPYVIAMPAGATSLASQVDATLARLRSSGALARIMGLSGE
jgi:ABC-type amino acid transport substrate-binding protein